jgi:F-box-like
MPKYVLCASTQRNISQRLLTGCYVGQVIFINVLPDDLLLAIFDFCVDGNAFTKKEMETWQSLVHVCRRWRSIVFESPRRLKLQLVCTTKTPARDTLDVWPSLPLLVRDSAYLTTGLDNIIASLEHSDRVCQINLMGVPGYHLEKISAAMQEPFPELIHLLLWSHGTAAVLPDSFLGGSAPRLQLFWLDGIPFPSLPKLLSSATHLVTLHLVDIPHSGYFSPEAMAASLSTLTGLVSFRLGFRSPRSLPDQASRRPPPPTRTILPALTNFSFRGVSEYLDDLVAYIDTPRVNSLFITFFNQIVFDTPQFTQFISRIPTLKALEKARVDFEWGLYGGASVNLSSKTSGYGELTVRIQCSELDWQISSLEQVCTSSLPPLSMLEDLYIFEDRFWKEDKGHIENALWLELLRPFSVVKNLYLSEEFAPRIVPALGGLVGDRMTEGLPLLENIFLEGLQSSGPIQKDIAQFVVAQGIASHPIAVTRWNRVRDEDGH